uniref:Ig-like domain-containing protein n=1 Tax=Cyprinus carpio TaxID=7962 RepID=A0A8C1QUH2_CYPCA
MSDECRVCLLGLIFLSSLLTGISGVNDAQVFISSGENVRLPCNNALHHCTSTTWIYQSFTYSGTVELIGLGIKKKDTERHERLSLGSDCSLNIRNISKEDYGSYTCQQWTGVNRNQKLGPDARVYLHVLHVSSSQTEISAGLSVTLFCQLYSYPRVSCDDLIRSERIQLFWVNQTGVKLTRSDSRYQILSSSDHCIITLNTTLLNEDDNREWRCEVTQRDQVKTSVTYTVKSSAQTDSTTAVNTHVTKGTSSVSSSHQCFTAALRYCFLLKSVSRYNEFLSEDIKRWSTESLTVHYQFEKWFICWFILSSEECDRH